jgi:acyl-CoA synthetase (AMP-forming)/AMP-acid ligase II
VAPWLASHDPERRRSTDGHAIGAAELMLAANSELLVRGPELFAGYLSDEQTGEAVDTDGWFHTGDLAEIDDAGWLTIIGRLKDIVIRAGENISTREVEEVLRRHPDIDDAVAVGLPHPRLGEQVGVAIVARRPMSVEDCGAWFTEQGLAPFKCPEAVVVLSTLPMLPTGKVDRQAVRERLTADRDR